MPIQAAGYPPPVYLDSALQKLRVDVQKFRGDSSNELLATFLKWYNSLWTTVGMIYDPVVSSKNQWAATCKGFPLTMLTPDSKRLLEDLCSFEPFKSILQSYAAMGKSGFFNKDAKPSSKLEESMDGLYESLDSFLENLMSMHLTRA